MNRTVISGRYSQPQDVVARRLLAVGFLITSAVRVPAQGPQRAPSALALDAAGMKCVDRELAALTEQARASFPQAVRWLQSAGPFSGGLSVMTELSDGLRHRERVFVTVDSIIRTKIYGRIANEVVSVAGYRRGQLYALPITELLDWTIVRDDRTEMGNRIGKHLEQIRRDSARVDRPMRC